MNLLYKMRKPFKYSYFNATLILVGINILVYVITSRFINLKALLSLNVYNVINGHAYWQFLSYMFVHGNFSHLFSNMFGLLVFGLSVERALGSKEFLLFYFVTGILTGVSSFFFNWAAGNYFVFLMGASGAIYAVLLLYAVAFPRSIVYIWGIIPIPAPVLVLVYAAMEIFNQVSSRGGNVAHYAHLAGFVFAWLYSLIRLRVNPWKILKQSLLNRP